MEVKYTVVALTPKCIVMFNKLSEETFDLVFITPYGVELVTFVNVYLETAHVAE